MRILVMRADAAQQLNHFAGEWPEPGANGTAIIAKLISGLDTAQCKPGDSVDAQVVHDVKQGSQVVVKRGLVHRQMAFRGYLTPYGPTTRNTTCEPFTKWKFPFFETTIEMCDPFAS